LKRLVFKGLSEGRATRPDHMKKTLEVKDLIVQRKPLDLFRQGWFG